MVLSEKSVSAWGVSSCNGSTINPSKTKRTSQVSEIVLDDEFEVVTESIIQRKGSVMSKSSVKISETSLSTCEIIEPVKKEKVLDNEGLMQILVKDYFSHRGLTSVLESFDKEKSSYGKSSRLSKQDVESMLAVNTSKDKNPVKKPILEKVLIKWITKKRKLEYTDDRKNISKNSKSTKTPSDLKERNTKSLSKKKKPKLSVLTTCGDLVLGEPGSTPHHPSCPLDLGRPGSTPKPRVEDLVFHGIDDLEINSEIEPDSLADHEREVYPINKKGNASKKKRVNIGESGSTPTKEYIFCRQTPPSFVTETIEEAFAVSEKLARDPNYAIEVERYIELSSSDVSKYVVGRRVKNLGARGDISGVIFKKIGTKQCGTGGPGTLVIDTQPKSEDEELKELLAETNLDEKERLVHKPVVKQVELKIGSNGKKQEENLINQEDEELINELLGSF